MRVKIGDRIAVRRQGAGERRGQVVDTRGQHGQPPFVVRWDNGYDGVLFPDGDVEVERLPAQR